jgi:hypothetical protein
MKNGELFQNPVGAEVTRLKLNENERLLMSFPTVLKGTLKNKTFIAAGAQALFLPSSFFLLHSPHA